ncbi:hypothetical protein UFOVP193_40 [uncultured Caudovirales phage]|uniref:Uncharacterized protein n=1 Tax=uncultured Caudovirales phage TaxID=2100421 RepID=A0A6J7WNL4_9CAUD|nr:hypothetical protein UFOVP193_40 [uncultured Caudovirales phage]
MAITVKHKFVSAIPDGDDSSLVKPSNWNDTHELTGLGTMAEQNANAVAITGGTISGVSVSGYVPTTTTITAGTGLTGGGDLSANRTIALANTAVTTGTYGNAARTITQTVDQQGRLTNIFDQPIAIANTQVSGLGTASTKDAGVALGVATLDAAGKVPLSEIPDSIIGALSYQGTWNASTNTPTLTSSVGTKGYYYVVSVAGTTNLNGITDWQVGDWAVYNGTAWQKIDNTDSVTSVNGFTGAVVLTTTNIAEGTNLYYTDARARAAISAGTGLSYNSTTGAMNFSTAAVGTWAATPSSANLAAAMTDETGSGLLVFNTAPSISALTIDGANPYIQFNNGSAVTVAAGKQWYDGSTGSWNLGMGGGNITQQVGEELYYYGKASTAITDSPLQIVYKTGTVGASGTITFAPTISGITDGDAILGVATENIALNGFGRITTFGVVHGITTNGTAYGETWADGDVIWYNPVTGNPTKVKPVAPNIKVQIGTILNAGSGGSGSIQVEINHGSVLGGTDSNVQLTSVSNGNILTYGGASGYWKNTDLTAGTGISISKSSDGVLTVTNSLPSLGGTVTSVGQTFTGGLISVAGSPITSSGTLALTVAGTSGGIPYFSGASTWASSAALAANALMIGGGAGVAPSTITTGTGVTTALGVNTGSAGAFVVNGGALGTPSSGTVTNLTGTASININGTVGATTANTGAFTTLSASSTVSGTGFSTYLASPPAIGGTTAAAITGTTITATKFVGVSGGTF